MWRQASSSTLQSEWQAVSRDQPCGICGAHNRCSLGADGEFACCLTTPSEWPIVSGGWLHRVVVEVKRPILV